MRAQHGTWRERNWQRRQSAACFVIEEKAF